MITKVKKLNKTIILVVAGILVDKANKVLIAQRPLGKYMEGFWEFPGGKVKLNETPEFALNRELKEELNIDVKSVLPFTFVSYPYENFHLLMPVYIIHRWIGNPISNEGQQLKWILVDNIENSVDMLPANIPVIKSIKSYINNN